MNFCIHHHPMAQLLQSLRCYHGTSRWYMVNVVCIIIVTCCRFITTTAAEAAISDNSNSNDSDDMLNKAIVLHEKLITMNNVARGVSSSSLELKSSITNYIQQQGEDMIHRRDETDPCIELLNITDSCLPNADPTCGSCVRTTFETTFLSNLDTNFTCTEFESGICPILYQNCSCAPCHTELEMYFSCVLNDASNNQCPITYCDPFKDYSNTPETCGNEVTLASACIDLECLSCLDTEIDAGVPCPIFDVTTCSALYISCDACIPCRDVILSWLSCLSQESFSCNPLLCDKSNMNTTSLVPTIVPPTITPSISPSIIILNTTNTNSPTLVPQISIEDTPTIVPVPVPVLAVNRSIPTTNPILLSSSASLLHTVIPLYNIGPIMIILSITCWIPFWV